VIRVIVCPSAYNKRILSNRGIFHSDLQCVKNIAIAMIKTNKYIAMVNEVEYTAIKKLGITLN